jgi:hypothetical protein
MGMILGQPVREARSDAGALELDVQIALRMGGFPWVRSMPLAHQPYRHLPRHSQDARLALQSCERVGLLREGGATLRQGGDGTWILEPAGQDALLHDVSLPSLRARAALSWHRHRPDFRKGLP